MIVYFRGYLHPQYAWVKYALGCHAYNVVVGFHLAWDVAPSLMQRKAWGCIHLNVVCL
jgi:hypothetical protein